MELSKQPILGTRQPRRYITIATVGMLVGCFLAFLLQLDTAIPLSRGTLGFVVFLTGLAFAAYAGWAHGGALPGVSSVFLLVFWMAIFPPAVAYLRRREYAGGRYSTVTLSNELSRPGAELGHAIGQVPYILLGVLLFGGATFLLGAGARKLIER